MGSEYDIGKNQVNIDKHGISFEEIKLIDWSSAITAEDTRHNYGEKRYITFAICQNKLHCLVWTIRNENIRPISFRKANKRERYKYEQKIRYKP